MLEKILDAFESKIALLISGLSILASLLLPICGVEIKIWYDPAWLAVILSGIPLLENAIGKLIRNKGISKISSALLITSAMIAAIAIGDVFAAGEVAFIMAIGELLEDMTTDRAKRGLTKLISLAPATGPSPASRPSPTDPALRANPYPEVTDPACRLPLPTLFQHARGCSPWRPAADMGTARREIYTLSPGFSRASESSPDAAGTATLSKARAPLSGRTHSRAPCPSQRKENSPRGSRRLLRDRSRYRTGRLAAPVSATPDSGI